MDVLLFYYQALVIGFLLVFLGTVIANLACFERLRASPAPSNADAPLISVLVPARNEARNIGPCVRSLLGQDYPNYELLVLDDHSEDETAEIIRGFGVGESTGPHRLLKGNPLPAGWTGKGWACHQLAVEARGEFLFFTDADTEHAPGTVSALVASAQRHRADLVSAWPRLLTRTWGESLVIPMILFLGLIMYPHWLVLFLQERPYLAARLPASFRRALGAANGQSIFFRRSGYEKIGGHAALSGHLVEDVALGRAVAARMGEGMRLINCDALEFSTCRMYRNFPEVWEGFTKNMRAAFEDSLGSFLGLGALHWCAFMGPFIAFALGWPGRFLIVSQIAIVLSIRVLLTVRFRTSWWSAIFHPISEVL